MPGPSDPTNLPPPPNLEGSAAMPAKPGGWAGIYAGEATNAGGPLGDCRPSIKVVDFHVAGNKVDFGRFHGTIEPNGTLQMDYLKTWISGRFRDGMFIGRIWQQWTDCEYQMTLARTP